MADSILSACLLRIALPIFLTLSIIFRPCLLSAMYLLLLFYLPVVPVPTCRTMSGHTGCYLKMVICISFLTASSQVIFQAVLLSLLPYGEFLKDCEFLEQILRHVGFIRLNGLSAIDVIQWLSPEIVMLFTSISIYVSIRKLTNLKSSSAEATTEEGVPKEENDKSSRTKYGILLVIGRYVSLASLAVAGCLRPSIPGGFYFLIFLGGATWWACYKELRKAYAYVCRFVLLVLFFHISVLYAYQFQWPQEYLSPNSTYARYFGLTAIISFNCDNPRLFLYNDLEWASYLNPIWLLWLYYVLAFESKLLLMPQTEKAGKFSRLDGTFHGRPTERISTRRLARAGTTHQRWQIATRKVRVFKEASVPTETTPLIRDATASQKYVSPRSTLHQDSIGSVTIAGGSQDDIPMQTLGKGPVEEELQASFFDNVVYGLASIMQVLVRSSYVATNITMMAWSITYHSWLTFVLLLWANLLWLLPNQRRAMLRSAPFLVIYAEFLLLSAYVYSMNLTEDELPSKYLNINLAQIGFDKILILPCNPLLVKCLYTTMFWITLRQFMQERHEARQTSALADMVAPLEVTVGAATTALPKEQETKGSLAMKKVGEYLTKFLTKFWIWVVAINLFLVAITGDRMTGFRIIYMFLFLAFILTFQLSFNLWRKVMFGFWLTVIGYSMLTLVLVYTYQFDNFPDYWTTYLHIPPEQQLDIGLETYETKQLFVRLLTPTFFVVITVVQVHYFHNDFLEISKIRVRRPSVTQRSEPRSEASSAQGGPWDPESEKTDTEATDVPNINLNTFKEKSRLLALLKYVLHKADNCLNYLWLFLELHMSKVVLLVSLLLTVHDSCAIHLAILLLAVAGVALGRKVHTCAIHVCSVIVSVMLLTRMIYQIKYIHHNWWDVTCDDYNNTTNATHYNNAAWLGFHKIDQGRTLTSIVKWYVIFITFETIRSIVSIRQRIWRTSEGQIATRPYFMFPKITRAEADKSITKCVKYLLNFGYYKFGVEISLMATVALIGTRMDFYACLYGIWLCVMCMMNRKALNKIWNWYLAFVTIILPIQYFMVVGLPPGLCIVFPWDEEGADERLQRMQEWMFLLGVHQSPSPKKLICDIFVLILVARQALVFRIEHRYDGDGPEYRGGSNQSIIHKLEEPDFVNPVPDFVTYIRSWLDIFKRGIIQSFMWITLAIVFLAGTNRVNFFSLGYLVGSFIFLWQGSDLYLRPVQNILKAWNWLLGYNVFVIIAKSILQIWGCIFIDDVSQCWLLRLLGIGCIQKFVPFGLHAVSPTQCSPVPREDIGLAWDGLCFGFLIMQRRIFNSYNFFHIIDEAKAATILASRGADLMEELREKQMAQKEEVERKILEKIKQKMDRIKATQQKIQGPSFKDPTNHFVESAPIARSPSLSSCTSTSATSEHTAEAGYHTPIDEEEPDEDPAPLTPRAGSLLQTQAPTPCSALMTVSLEGYLDPQRMSFSSPPNSELNPRPLSPDESFPVFSPPPYETAVGDQRPPVQRQTSIGPPWMQGCFITPRQSVISYSSRSPQSHHTYSIFPGSRPLKPRKVPTDYKAAIRSGDYYMFDDVGDEELDLISEKDDDDSELNPDDLTLGQFITTAMKSQTKSRRTSAPAAMLTESSDKLMRQRSYVSTRSYLSAPFSILSKSDKGSPRRSDRSRVRISVEEREEIDSPKPGSSKQKEEEEESLLSEHHIEESKERKILNILSFIWGFLESIMNTATSYLHRISRDYRYVLRVLSKEKKLLKEKTNYRVGIRRASTHIWEPAGSFQSLIRQTRYFDDDDNYHKPGSSLEPMFSTVSTSHGQYLHLQRRKTSVLTVPEIRILAPSLERGLDSSPRSESPVDIMAEYETAEMSSADQPPIVRLLQAIWFAILSHSDVVCYFVIFLNQIKSASLLSLPLPLMVFLWGTLTIPRPSKTFWITIIAYTEAIVLIKCVFQFKILDEVVHSTSPFHPPRIIGIERSQNYATYDLILLLVVFFHRVMLKTLGLWKAGTEPLESIKEGMYQLGDDDDLHTLSSKIKIGSIQALDPDIPSTPHPQDAKKARATSLTIKTASKILFYGELSDAYGNQREEEQTENETSNLKLTSQQSDSIKEEPSDPNGEGIVVHLSAREVHTLSQMPGAIKMGAIKYLDVFHKFFKQLLDPTSRITADVYAYMFLCDFFNFMVVIFGFAAFGTQQGDGGVSAYLQENKVPIPFLLMLILQFILIIVDRALFLRKYILGKIIFQFLQIIGVHIWMFFVLPGVTERSFNALLPPQMWYMVKCFYLLLSAYQIRCGYPTRILGNFLCKGYNYVHMLLFKVFMAIPFLFELRTIMDWMWTDTSMTIFDWLKMEDIFAHIFQLKCSRHAESEFPQPRGEKKNTIVKYFMGGAGLFAIIAVIWFPLVFFALGNTVGEANIPYDVTINVRIGSYQPIYSMSAQTNAIHRFGLVEYNTMQNVYKKDRTALTFLSSYENEDVAAVILNGNSTMIWAISPPDIERMLQELQSDKNIALRLQYIISRISNNKQDSGIVANEIEIAIPAKIADKPNPNRINLIEMLQGNKTEPAFVKHIFPKFVKVSNSRIITPVSQLLSYGNSVADNSLRNLNMRLARSNETRLESSVMWWELKEDCTDENYVKILRKLPRQNCEYLVMYTFNEKSFPASLSFLSGGGIIGLYTTLVFVASRMIRGFFSEICFKIMFDDMPNVDRILQLCLDIYLVREARELCLEEDLFAKLVFLFRSPETLIKWTRPKEDDENDGDDPEAEPQQPAIAQ